MSGPTGSTRITAAAVSVIFLLLASGAPSIRATGTVEALTQSGNAIASELQSQSVMPIVWRFHDPTPAGCTYSAPDAPPATLQPAVAVGFQHWEDDPDSAITLTYGGTTATAAAGSDGINLVTFCDPTVLAANPGWVALTSKTILAEAMTVTAGGGCPAGEGPVEYAPGMSICFPEGTYAAGTIVDADILFNTFGTLEASTWTTNNRLGKFDVEAVTTHEVGHVIGLSHDPIPQASMFPFVDDVPASDGLGQAVLKRSDLGTAGRYYPEPGFSTNYGTITGHITLDGAVADGVHVVAIDPNTMLGVAGRWSLSQFEDPDSMGPEGADILAEGGGFYRLDGLPPGEYYVYVEYLDDSDFFSGRLSNLYNLTVANSNVAQGMASAGPLGFLPALTEFHDTGESGDGGDGINPGTAADNSDRATLVSVSAGNVTAGVDIAINIEPVNGETPADRENPTARTMIPNDARLPTDGYAIARTASPSLIAARFPASELPAPPYNVAEGHWIQVGLNASMPTTLALPHPSIANTPDLAAPLLVISGRFLHGGPGGAVAGGEVLNVRDQWNVTINQPTDLWVVLSQPPNPSSLNTNSSLAWMTARRVARTRYSLNDGATWGNLSADMFYDLLVEEAPPVMITGAAPGALLEGSSATISVGGSGFEDGATVDFGPDVVIDSVTFVNSQQIDVGITIPCVLWASDQVVDVAVRNPEVLFPNVSRIFTIQAAPGLDDDCDGVLNGDDCDPSNPGLSSSAPEVTNVAVGQAGAAEIVSWDDLDTLVGSDTVYDIIGVPAASLSLTGDYSLATCVANDLEAGPFVDDGPDPAPGEATGWLVRGYNLCNPASGTWGDGTGIPDPRDDLDLNTFGCTTCGNGVAEGTEVCDGGDFSGETCQTQGFGGGSLGCAATCDAFDTGGCFTCGNDVIEASEECDGANLGGATCVTLGFDTGTLACTAACAFDTSGCSACGNDLVEGSEVCDGTDLAGETCMTQGFGGGSLGCAATCDALDTGGCFTCGNDVIEATEECDGANLGGATCVTLGFDTGTLACTAACAFDTSGCSACGNDLVEGPEVCDGTDLAGETCQTQGFSDGNLACAATCDALDGSGCYTCGNDTIEGPETCDGANLGGETCLSLGFAGGTLGCQASCLAFDLSGCTGTHLASVPNGRLIKVNEATAAAAEIGNIGVNSFSDLALASDGSLFGSRGFSGTGEILSIHPGTAAMTIIGSSGFDAVPALDFGPPGTPYDGVLYGVGIDLATDTEHLITIDTATGVATSVGTTEWIEGIVFLDDGRLFGVAWTGNDADRILMEINPADGTTTTVGPIGFGVVGLELTTGGAFIGSVGGRSPNSGSLVLIDPVTGAGTLIGPTGFSPVSGLTKLP